MNISRNRSDEKIVFIKTEYCHLLHSAAIRIDSLGLHHIHVRHLDSKTYSHISFRSQIGFRSHKVIKARCKADACDD